MNCPWHWVYIFSCLISSWFQGLFWEDKVSSLKYISLQFSISLKDWAVERRKRCLLKGALQIIYNKSKPACLRFCPQPGHRHQLWEQSQSWFIWAPSSQTGSGISPSLHRIGGAMPHWVLMDGCFQSCLIPVRALKLDFFLWLPLWSSLPTSRVICHI